ncbi:MAG: DUF6946 family protein [Terriglobia bacterium]
MVSMRYGDKVVADFEQIVKLLIPGAVLSPVHSTVPLVDFWRRPDSVLAQLSGTIGVELSPPIGLCFEYPVPVQRGRGKASFTDLMITASSAAVAIEAKFTEPRGETVHKWLRDPPETNRTDVLEGWLDLIRKVTGASLSVHSVMDLPYQLIHRTASVCSVDRPDRRVVYQIFFRSGRVPPDYYPNDLNNLWERLGRPVAPRFHVVDCPLRSRPAHENLVKRWEQGERQLGEAVRDALLKGPLFFFQ